MNPTNFYAFPASKKIERLQKNDMYAKNDTITRIIASRS